MQIYIWDCCDHMLLHVVISWSWPDVMLDQHTATAELRTSHQGVHVVCLFVCLRLCAVCFFFFLNESAMWFDTHTEAALYALKSH